MECPVGRERGVAGPCAGMVSYSVHHKVGGEGGRMGWGDVLDARDVVNRFAVADQEETHGVLSSQQQSQ